jgi:hypothetical protein
MRHLFKKNPTAALERSIRDLSRKALMPEYSVSQLLREVSFLGSRLGANALTQWATLELNGYGDAAPLELPEYRKVNAAIMADTISPRGITTNIQLSRSHFPLEIQDNISTDFEICHSLPMVESFNQAIDATLKFGLPNNADLAALMNHVSKDVIKYERIYWAVPKLAMTGVIEGIRNRLVALLSDLGAAHSISDISINDVLTKLNIDGKKLEKPEIDSIINRKSHWFLALDASAKIATLIAAVPIIAGAIYWLLSAF